MRALILIENDGSAKLSGVEMGRAEVHQVSQNRLVLKVAGGNYWSGAGQTAYFPAHFQVYEDLEWLSPNNLRGTKKFEIPLRRKEPLSSILFSLEKAYERKDTEDGE